ncbi:universal stress protein [Cytobacillus sp. S13-E01]|uniref:universal stress protein n=1 Tax=Cytobacillus sp. S13-E01 TaxID=3031326 RepID=UPI0023D87D8B|nr:universal stress protein [Cytobacillus sp. S13-E01]MDF0727287.1 universal stress protein [Cytobacillus sp. S13-E01]
MINVFKNILLAWDGSEHSTRAVDKAIEIAKCDSESKVVVVYVADTSKAKSEVLQNWNNIDITGTKELRFRNIEEKVKKSEIQYEIKMLQGEPGPAIVEYTNKNQFDVVVIGSRGLNALQEMVLGSVSHKIAKRANCPVLIVK